MESLRFIEIEWNKYNGFILGIIGYNNRHLFSINSSWKEFFHFEVLFLRFEIYDKIES